MCDLVGNFYFLFFLVSTVCTLHQHLLDWHKTLIAIGVFFLVVGVGVAVLIIVYKVLSEFMSVVLSLLQKIIATGL